MKCFQVLLMVMLGLVSKSQADFTFLEPERFDVPAVHVHYESFPANDFNLTAPFIEMEEEWSACEPYSGPYNLTGKIVVVIRHYCDLKTKLENLHLAGAVAMVIPSGCGWVPGAEIGQIGGIDELHDHKPIPVLAAGLCDSEHYQRIKTSGMAMTVYINSLGSNPWDEAVNHYVWLPLYVVLGAATIACFVAAAYKTFFFFKHHKGAPLVYYVLVTEMCVAIERLLTYVDPVGSRHIYPIEFANTLLWLALPFALSTSMAIAFVWMNSMLAAKMVTHRTSKPLLVVCVALFVVLLLLEVIAIVFRVLVLPAAVVITIPSVLYIVSNFGIGLWFIIVGIKVFRKLNNPLQMTNKEVWRRKLRMMTIRIAVSGIGMMISAVLTALWATPLLGSPWGFYLLIYLLQCTLVVISFAQVMAFETAGREHTSQHASTNVKSSSTKRETVETQTHLSNQDQTETRIDTYVESEMQESIDDESGSEKIEMA